MRDLLFFYDYDKPPLGLMPSSTCCRWANPSRSKKKRGLTHIAVGTTPRAVVVDVHNEQDKTRMCERGDTAQRSIKSADWSIGVSFASGGNTTILVLLLMRWVCCNKWIFTCWANAKHEYGLPIEGTVIEKIASPANESASKSLSPCNPTMICNCMHNVVFAMRTRTMSCTEVGLEVKNTIVFFLMLHRGQKLNQNYNPMCNPVRLGATESGSFQTLLPWAPRRRTYLQLRHAWSWTYRWDSPHQSIAGWVCQWPCSIMLSGLRWTRMASLLCRWEPHWFQLTFEFR